jgi:charged multivesicular body protein 2B
MTQNRSYTERQEKQLEAEIRAKLKAGDRASAGVLAKQLVRLRGAKTRNVVAATQMTGLAAQATSMHSTATMAKSMGVAAQAAGKINAQIDLPALQQTMQQFARETTQMDMADELMGDALDSLFDADGDEEEADAIMGQVLDEIGIEVSGRLASAPRSAIAGTPATATAASADTDALLSRLAALKTPA